MGAPRFRPRFSRRSKREIRERCPVILNFSTGTITDDVSPSSARTSPRAARDRRAQHGHDELLRSTRARGRRFVFDMVFSNTYEKIIKLLKAMNEARVKPELECFDSGHTQGVWPLVDMGLLKPPLQFSFIVGVLGGIPGRDRIAAAADQDHAAGQRVGVHRHQPWPLAHARHRDRAGRQRAHRPRGSSLPAGRRDGAVQRSSWSRCSNAWCATPAGDQPPSKRRARSCNLAEAR